MEILIVGFWILCGFVSAGIYTSKGRSGAAAFIIGILLGPIGVLLALLTPADKASQERKQVQSGGMMRCAFCKELMRRDATVCPHCQREQPTSAQAAPINSGRAHIEPNGTGGFVCSSCGGGVRQDATTCKHCRKVFAV